MKENEIKEMNSLSVNNAKFALSTIDNPYDPFSQFNDWWNYDNQKGYGSSQYLARVAHTSDQLSDAENDEELENAIDEIIKNDFIGIYEKRVNNNYKTFQG